MAAGYTTRTWGPLVTVTPPVTQGKTWFSFNQLSNTEPAGSNVPNLDSTLTLTGASGNTYNAGIASTYFDSGKTNHWGGTAFGCGAYFEAVIRYFPSGTQSGNGFPSVWTMSVEHLQQFNTGDAWTGQNPPYTRWPEFDLFEWVSSDTTHYKATIFDHYNNGSTTTDLNSSTSVSIGAADPTQFHKIGGLWKVASSGVQGSLTWYYDDNVIRSAYSWNLFNSATSPPPVDGTTLGNFSDQSHMTFILGSSSTNWPFIIKSASVWQGAGACNVTH